MKVPGEPAKGKQRTPEFSLGFPKRGTVRRNFGRVHHDFGTNLPSAVYLRSKCLQWYLTKFPRSRNLLKTSKGLVNKGHFTEFCSESSPLGSNDTVAPSLAIEAHSVALPVQILFSIGNMLNGIGGTAFFIAGVTYTDDNVKKKNSPIYFGNDSSTDQ